MLAPCSAPRRRNYLWQHKRYLAPCGTQGLLRSPLFHNHAHDPSDLDASTVDSGRPPHREVHPTVTAWRNTQCSTLLTCRERDMQSRTTSSCYRCFRAFPPPHCAVSSGAKNKAVTLRIQGGLLTSRGEWKLVAVLLSDEWECTRCALRRLLSRAGTVPLQNCAILFKF